MEDKHAPETWMLAVTLMSQALHEFQVRRCPELSEMPVEKAAEAIYSLDLAQSESIEASIRHFARNKTWPAMEAKEAACIYLRLDFAVRSLFFCAAISVPGQPANLPTEPDALEEEEIYEWSLIKIWNSFGRQQTATSFLSSLHLLGFERPK